MNIDLITHGNLAEGLKDASEVILGSTSEIKTLGLKTGQDVEAFGDQVRELISKTATSEGLLVFVDLLSATPYNQVLMAIQKLQENKEKVYVIAGASLPLLLEALNGKMLNQDIETIVENLKAYIISPDYIWQFSSLDFADDDDDDF